MHVLASLAPIRLRDVEHLPADECRLIEVSKLLTLYGNGFAQHRRALAIFSERSTGLSEFDL